MCCCIRGAITIEENTKECIWSNTELMLGEIIKRNSLSAEDIISVVFTATRDIDAAYPAVALRKMGITEASLICMQEMYVKGSLPMCIRVMVTVAADKPQRDMEHVYLKGAVVLRPDLVKKKTEAIAIDGPAGSGKSTVAKLIAKELDYIYVDTGAMYRAVGLYCINNNIDYTDAKAVEAVLEGIDIDLVHSEGMQRIFLNGRDVTEDIRTPAVADSASKVAAIGAVRQMLVALQKSIVRKNKVVMDGRDIGTNVIPDARVKIYLDANVPERAKRRCHELEEKGIAYDFDAVAKDISARDEYDKNMELNPLTVAEDALVIDTSDMTVDEVKNKILETARG